MESQTIEIGQIYRIKADESNDITPSHDFEDFFLPIPCSKYSFLEHDCFIDCRKMKPSTLEKLLEGEFCGDIAQDDYQNVVKLLKMSPRETYVHLKTFGLI